MPAAGPSASVIERGGLEIDTDKRAARKNGRTVDLTAREFDLIELFIKNPGRVYSRDNLLNLVWGYDYQGDERTVTSISAACVRRSRTTPPRPG